MTVATKNSQIFKIKKGPISPFLKNRIVELKRQIDLDKIDLQQDVARALELQN